MYCYSLRPARSDHERTKRSSAYHHVVFHGVSTYATRFSESVGPPALTNSNRDPAHLARSGRFVPPVFSPRNYELIVSEALKERLSRLKNVEFVEVVMEQLVDLPMPAWGDFSFIDRPVPDEWRGDSHYYVNSLRDVPEFHATIGRYYSVLGANLHEVQERYDDIREVRLNFGTYWPSQQRETALLSAKALETYPFLRGRVHLIRDDAFAIIAPHLDLDLYAIAVIDLDEPMPFEDPFSPTRRNPTP